MRSNVPLIVDVLIIGGGPAGAACAIHLAKGGVRVAIVERSDFSDFRAGEILEASIGPLLLQLGTKINEQEWAAPCTGVAAAWAQPTAARRPSIFKPNGHGWCIDRKNFDRALFERARTAGAAAFMRCRLASAERHRDAWIFHLRAGADVLTGRAKWIVAATGRSARTSLAPSRARLWVDQLVGLALLDDHQHHSYIRMPAAPMVEATSGGWWYSLRLMDSRRMAIFFTDADLLPKRNHDRAAFLLKELDQGSLTASACSFLASKIARYCWIGFDARSSIRRVILSDGWIAVGDAMMAFDPLCGRGISEAINCGVEVADWLLQSPSRVSNTDALPAWIQNAANRFNLYQSERFATYGHQRRWPTSRFWQRRQNGVTSYSPVITLLALPTGRIIRVCAELKTSVVERSTRNHPCASI